MMRSPSTHIICIGGHEGDVESKFLRAGFAPTILGRALRNKVGHEE